MKLTDFAWIIALATWVPDLVSRGVLSENYGWIIALAFVTSLAGSRISEATLIGKTLHMGVPIAALMVLVVQEMGEISTEALITVLHSVLPMLVVLFCLYFLIIGLFGGPGSKRYD